MINLKKTVYYRGAISALDQGMISLINLAVQILLIKNVSKNEFGYYSVAFSIIMYLMSFQNAVVNTPITVSLASKQNDAKNIYLSAVFNGQFYLLIIICSVGAVISFISKLVGFNSNYSLLSMSIFIGSFGILNREFLRSYFFAEEQPGKVLKLDIYYGLIYIGLIVLSFFFYKISVPLVLVFMGLAASFDSLILNKSFKYKFSLNEIKKAYKENWLISKWSLIGITVTHIQGFAYLYVIGIILGEAAMGEVSASRLLLMPLGLITNGWGNVARPYGAKLREQGKLKKFFKNLLIAGFVFPVFVLVLVGIMYMFSDFILTYFFTNYYKKIFEYLLFWAVLSSIGFLQANASYGLQVIKKFKSLAIINAGTMILTVVSSIILTKYFGIKGALTASLIGSLSFASILWYILYKSIYLENKYNE